MEHKRRRPRPVDSLSGVMPPPRRRRSNKEHYLGIEPLPPEPKHSSNKTIIEAKIPKLKRDRSNFPYGRQVFVGAVILMISAGLLVTTHYLKKDIPKVTQGSSQVATFKPLTTANDLQSEISRSQDQRTLIASAKDQIAGVDVVVNQQPLPDNFKHDPDAALEKFAKSIHAEKIIYAVEVKAFSGVSREKSGAQTIVFAKKDVLVFINAKKEVDKDALVQYIIELK